MSGGLKGEGTLPRAYESTILERIALEQRVAPQDVHAYREQFHGVAKHLLWTMYLLCHGQVHDGETGEESQELHLPYRLSEDQWQRVREGGALIWSVLEEGPKLKPTPISAAKGDDAFQRFLEGAMHASTGKRQPRRRK